MLLPPSSTSAGVYASPPTSFLPSFLFLSIIISSRQLYKMLISTLPHPHEPITLLMTPCPLFHPGLRPSLPSSFLFTLSSVPFLVETKSPNLFHPLPTTPCPLFHSPTRAVSLALPRKCLPPNELLEFSRGKELAE